MELALVNRTPTKGNQFQASKGGHHQWHSTQTSTGSKQKHKTLKNKQIMK